MPPQIDTRVTRLLGIRYPIVQGGLARVATAPLAAAVSNAGGLGQIASAGLDGPAALRAEIRRCRALTALPFAVNFPIGRQDIRPGLERWRKASASSRSPPATPRRISAAARRPGRRPWC